MGTKFLDMEISVPELQDAFYSVEQNPDEEQLYEGERTRIKTEKDATYICMWINNRYCS
jgi:hypothetical protein